MTLSQQDRSLSVSTPLGEDVLLLRSMSATERLSTLFEYELELISEDVDINHEDLLGQPVTVRLGLPDDEERFFNGIVNSFSHVGFDGAVALYVATLVPWTWFLTRTADCRIFQEKTVPDIIKEIFREHGHTDFQEHLSGEYRQWVYCVQYRETDFNFISRLMEQEGIYYYFTHANGKHTLVLADSYSAHSAVEGYEEIPYYPPDETALRERDHISDWSVVQAVQPGTFAHTDYDFTAPKKNLLAKRSSPKVHELGDLEIYDYPGEYLDSGDGDTYARVRLEEMHAGYETVRGEGNARGLAVGSLFNLTNYRREDQNREYLIVSANYQLQSDVFGSSGAASGAPSFQCRITAIDAQTPFRSNRITPKPIVQGPQTATVVGKSGEKIWTDKYGRVKVQFHWDRYGKADEHSSCWVRVSHPWAGKNWGDMFMPHIGQEVIVSFLEGDPDRPIITGRVYNQDNMPPEGLPGNQTKSVWRDHGGNETIMEGDEGKQSIHTQQSCGNEFLMDGSSGGEKIELRDKYGNELVMDAVAGTITIHSPTHESKIVLGKSIDLFSLSDLKSKFMGNMHEQILGKKKVEIGNDVLNFFAGLQNKTVVGMSSKVIGGVYNKLVGGAKHEIIRGFEFKNVKGVKSEVINGRIFKSGDSVEYKLNKADNKGKGPSLKQQYKLTQLMSQDYKASVKADAKMDVRGKLYNKANTIFDKAEDYKGYYKTEKRQSDKLYEKAAKVQVKASKLQQKADTYKCKAKAVFNDGALKIS